MKEQKVQKKSTPSKGKDARPWEKMNGGKDKAAGKTGDKREGKSGVSGKNEAKGGAVAKAPEKKPAKAPRYCDFLYLLPKRASAKELGNALSFLKKGSLEIWEEDCILEITTENGTITFEDIRDSLEKEDEKILSGLRMKQVLSCDYVETDRELVRKVMTALMDRFGGRIGSDTEDFAPFMNVEEI